MDSVEIRSIMKCDPEVPFRGVYAADKIPRIVSKTSAMVFNTDPAHKEGKHWVAVYFKDGRGHYFDSYGRRPPLDFASFMTRNSHKWTWNKKCMQSFGSNVCGHYCLYFLHEMSRGKQPRFPSQGTDKFVASAVKRFYGDPKEYKRRVAGGGCNQCCKKRRRKRT